MKSALKKSVVSTSISLILASGMAAFAAHAADDVKLKATKTNVAFSDFTPTEYSTKGKPNIIVLTMDDLGYGQLPFDKGSFDPKTMENREVVDTYKIGIDKAIEAAQKSTPTLLSLMKGASALIFVQLQWLYLSLFCRYRQLHDFPLFLGQKIPYQKEVVHNQDHPWSVR